MDTERLVRLLYKHGPAPSILAIRSGLSIGDLRSRIVANETLKSIYVAKVGEIVEAIRIFGADKTSIAQYLSTDRDTLTLWIEENQVARRAFDNAHAVMVDLGERNLLRALARGERWATEAVLFKTAEGRRRGYGEVTVTDVDRESGRLGIDWQRIVETVANSIAGSVIGDSPLAALTVNEHEFGQEDME